MTPNLIVYTAKQRSEGQKAVFTQVGVAFINKNRGGFTIKLDALPLGDSLICLPPKAEAKQ